MSLNIATNQGAAFAIVFDHTFCVNWDDRQIAGENQGTLRRKEKHVSRFKTYGRLLTVDAEPAIAPSRVDCFGRALRRETGTRQYSILL
jgi:hypothetical protein